MSTFAQETKMKLSWAGGKKEKENSEPPTDPFCRPSDPQTEHKFFGPKHSDPVLDGADFAQHLVNLFTDP